NPYILFGDLANYEFDLPPIERQRELANLLWAANDLKESYQKAIIATDEMLKAKFREMFGEAGDTSRGAAESRSKWPMVHLRDVCFGRASNGYFARQSEYNSDGNARIVSVTDVVNRTYVNIDGLQRISMSSKDLSRFSLKYGDMLFCRSSLVKEGIGKAAIIVPSEINDCVFECHLIKISLDTNICHPVFMEHLSWAAEFRKQIMGNSKTTTMTTISQDGILNVSIPLPPLSLQREFVAIAERADAAKSALKQSIADIEQVMKGLING
ncbi:MAG: restriction endonuclease subunit S, partial [Actinomycetaceae bacterium]|nr:restriction endonuclease subunit S [Actinomycetaceae bacterium]